MKKIILFSLIFIFAFGYALYMYPGITNKIVTLGLWFLLAFWFWGQLFVEYDTEIFPFLFLILKLISQNIKIFIFLFSIILLFNSSAYLSYETLTSFLVIVIFFPTLSKTTNNAYFSKSILLVAISFIIYLDLKVFKFQNISFEVLSSQKKTYGIFTLGLYFCKTMLHSSFYVLMISCFYEAINDYFYKNNSFSFKTVVSAFNKKLTKKLERWKI